MRFILLILFNFGSLFASASAAEPQSISVSAAISLKDAMEQIAKNYEAQTHQHISLTFGSSGQLAAQIKAGAPVEIFISAADAQMNDLEKAGLIAPNTRRIFTRNELVLIVPRSASEVPTDVKTLTDPKFKHLAIGEPRTVPAGQYAVQSLKSAGIDDAVKDRLVMGLNVRQVLEYVRRAEADAGIVYRTDAISAGDSIRIGPTLSGHDPIEYPAALTKSSADSAPARQFLDYLSSESARQVLTNLGFQMPVPAAVAVPAAGPTTSPAPR